jgi:hypothetical protein
VDLIVEALKPDEIGIKGDFIDCGRFSKHAAKSPSEQAQDFLEFEIKPAQNQLKQWREEQRVKKIWALLGNHEFRVTSWFTQNGMADLLPLVAPEVLLGAHLDEVIPYAPSGQNVMPHKRIADDAIVIHSWSHAKHAAQVNLGLAKSFSVFFGHTHRIEMASSRHPILDVEYVAMCDGTNSERQPRYGHSDPSGWGQGLTWIKFHGDLWTAYFIQIKNGSAVLPTGEVVRA